MNYTFIAITVTLFFACSVGTAQLPDNNVDGQNQKRFPIDSNKINPQILSFFSGRSLETVGDKYAKITLSINKQSIKLLKQMQRKEERLRSALALKDSAKAAELFANTTASYQQLQNKLSAPLNKTVPDPLKEYVPNLDSLGTSLNYLQKVPGLSPDKLQRLTQASGQLQELQGKMQAANEIKTFIKEREQQLKTQLSQYGLGKQLLGINKQAYAYSERIAEFKAVITDRKKLEEKIIATIRDIPAFKSFWQKNSILSRLFPAPDNFGTVQALAGLQKASQINGLIQQRMGNLSTTGGAGGAAPGGTAIPQQYVAQAQQQLSQLKDKVSQLGGTGGDMIMPDFQPATRKNKSFLKSLDYGMDIQTQGANNLLPAYSEIAFTIGYKAFSRLNFGTGIAYRLGFGRDWSHLSLSSEGIGLRTNIDFKTSSSSSSTISKLFGDIWITAGFEKNYMQSFKSLRELHDNVDVWQNSFLGGLTKRYKASKKEGKISFLYDFLAGQQIPRAGTSFKVRVGWGL